VRDLAPLAGRHVLLGVSGGIAAYKAAALARGLIKAGATVQVVMTASAREFVGAATFEGLTGRPVPDGVFDEVERVPHVALAREADVAIFAPATANLIAKLAVGIANDMVTSAFTCLTCPVVVAPAMHTEMWEHPATVDNVATLRRRGTRIIGPDEGALAGGDVGPGRLAEEDALLGAVADALGGAAERPPVTDAEDARPPVLGPLLGLHVVVTAGGTREPIDPVRFIGNRSSGKMGYAVAAEAARRGAVVDLVAGPTALPDPPGVAVHRVETALEMRDAVLPLARRAAVVVKAAAVADYRPADYRDEKIKKEEGGLDAVALVRNPDILAELGAQRGGEARPLLVGFAAETHDEEAQGRAKLARKRLDLIVVNRVDGPDAGFDVDTNRALLLGADGGRSEVPLTSKAALAAVLCDRVEALLASASRRP
jgi:phosphopantothenoylcysteine decarboxylase / phosphopantothenate---cysteine ligase